MNNENTNRVEIIVLILLLICSGLDIAAFIMYLTKKCGEGFDGANDNPSAKLEQKCSISPDPQICGGSESSQAMALFPRPENGVKMAELLPYPLGIDCMDTLRDAWTIIRDEAIAVARDSPVLDMRRSRKWDKNDIYLPRDGWVHGWRPDSDVIDNEKWLNYGLILNGKHIEPNSNICPKTIALLDAIPGLNVAGFSWICPGGCIMPHTDLNPGTRTWHLGLKVADPSLNVLCVQDSVQGKFNIANVDEAASVVFLNGQRVLLRNCTVFEEKDGRLLMFDDSCEHFAYNYSDQDRLLLYLNIDMPVNR